MCIIVELKIHIKNSYQPRYHASPFVSSFSSPFRVLVMSLKDVGMWHSLSLLFRGGSDMYKTLNFCYLHREVALSLEAPAPSHNALHYAKGQTPPD